MNWMGIHEPWAFIAAVLVFLALPGPGTFALLNAVGIAGPRGGFRCLGGLLLGDQVLIWLAVAGVAALLQAHPLLFHAVQYLGAAYLIWIGINLLRTRRGAGPGLVTLQPGRLFRQGFLVSVLNPKGIVFYMAFFPLFIDPEHARGAATFATMALLIALLSVSWCSLLIGLGHVLARQVAQHPRAGLWLRRAAGTGLVGFGVKLGLPG
ncbi:MAG TPA: lysine transporter LysE [Xanthomonadaceae bacterium]|nr:lysine transporter LysE [Xanthomonadaceae bacterium]